MKRGEKKAELEALIIQLLNDADEVSIRSVADAAGVPNDFTYNAAGAVTSLKLGNGKFESTQFNSRLQPTRIAL